jgi:hypothetical protein
MMRDVALLARTTSETLLRVYLEQATRCALTGCKMCAREVDEYKAAIATQDFERVTGVCLLLTLTDR